MTAHYYAIFMALAMTQSSFGQVKVAVSAPSGAQESGISEQYGKLPLSFEANEGQTAADVKFLSRGNGYSLFLTGDAAVLSLTRAHKRGASDDHASAQASRTDVIRMELVGAKSTYAVQGLDRLPGTANYFLGKDPQRWHNDLPTYARVKYSRVYPGIDLVYYGNQRQLEYDFAVAPRANPKRLKLHFDGATDLRLDKQGDLTVAAPDGQLAFHKPIIYQVKDGKRQAVDGSFVLFAGNKVGFIVGAYDHSRELVIDPILAYATYLGGSLGDFPTAIAVDPSGNAYITGSTQSTDFPVSSGAYQTTLGEGYSAAFVTKLNAAGTALVYSTYLGGAANDSGASATAIAVDSAGSAYVTGTTYSDSFPTTSGAYLTSPNNDVNLFGTSFVTKLSNKGSSLVYSTYLGGSLSDSAYGIAVDSAGDAYVTGQAESSTFPTTSDVVQPDIGGTAGSSANAFVTKFNASGSALVYSTFLGGSDFDGAAGIALDTNNDAYVTGKACSTDFPVTKGALQTKNGGAATDGCNAFVSELNPTATAFVYSTYLGGTNSDGANAITVDASGNAYVTGFSFSSDFPVTSGSIQTKNNALANQESNAFVSKLNAQGSALIYSTYLGGSGYSTSSPYIQYGQGDTGMGIGVDALGDVFVTGAADSANFPVTASTALQTKNNYAQEGEQGDAAAFLAEINPAGSALTYSTYLAGSVGYGEEGYGLTVDTQGNPYITGISSSSDFPVTTGAYQPANKASESGGTVGYTGFIAKFAPSTGGGQGAATSTSLVTSVNPGPHLQPVTFSAYVSSAGVGITGNVAISIDGGTPINLGLDDTGHAEYSTSSLTVGTHSVTATYAGKTNLYLPSSASVSEVILAVTSRPNFSPLAGNFTLPQSVTLTSPTGRATIYYTTDGTQPTTSSKPYTGAIRVTSTTTITAFALASGDDPSQIRTSTYTITPAPAAAPAFNPAPGTYTTSKTVTITDSTSGAVIYYTLNGSTPTASSTRYKYSLNIPSTATLKAIAIAPYYVNSPVTSGTYTILIHTTTALKSSPNPSVFGQAVTLTATVKAASGPTPTGTVIFTDAGVGTIGTGTLKNGVATITTTKLPEGTVTLSATYQTSATDLTSKSPVIKQVVNHQ